MTDQENEPHPEDLTDELARKYDPERLLRMVSRRAGKGELLDQSIRAKYERRFGVDLGHVRIYTGEFAEEFNRKHGSYAVTVGSTGMVLMGGSPEKSMGSASGQALLAHELTHVAQAHRGLHRKGTTSGGMPFTQEHEAEAESVEQSVAAAGGDHGADTKAATDAASQQVADKEALARAIEKIKERANELVADAVRNQIMRNGLQRRP